MAAASEQTRTGATHPEALGQQGGRAGLSVHDVISRVRRSLQMEELGVLPTQSQQRIMSAVLDHPPMIKNVDSVGGPYGGEPVRDDQRAAPSQHLMQR